MTPLKKSNDKKKVEGQNQLPKNQPRQPNTKQAPNDRDPNAQYEEKDES